MKKSINLKFKIKYTRLKRLAQQKLAIVKLKKIKSNQLILTETNKIILSLSNNLHQSHMQKKKKKKTNKQTLAAHNQQQSRPLTTSFGPITLPQANTRDRAQAIQAFFLA